jgi:phosphoserine phosphatase
MSYVATLISTPQRGAVTEALAARVAAKLPQGHIGGWLDPGIAVDIMFDSPPEKSNLTMGVVQKLRHELGEVVCAAPVDFVIQPQDGRRKKLLVADMDSTMIGQECIDELADYAGLKDRIAAITARAMRGEIAFAPALRERVALLQGLPAATIDKVIAERIRPNPGAAVLVQTMRAHGAYTCVVTGGFTAFMAPLAKAIGFDEYHANRLLTDGDCRLTGKVAEPVLGREAKRDTLLALRERLRLRPQDTLAVGDGANDVPMVEAAGLGVAFHGKPALREAAGACIDHGDLTALLYAQGYRREDFVEAG